MENSTKSCCQTYFISTLLSLQTFRDVSRKHSCKMVHWPPALSTGEAGIWQDISLFHYNSVLWGLSLLLWLSSLPCQVTHSSPPFWGYTKGSLISGKSFNACNSFRAFSLVQGLGVWILEHSGFSPAGFLTSVKGPKLFLNALFSSMGFVYPIAYPSPGLVFCTQVPTLSWKPHNSGVGILHVVQPAKTGMVCY